LVNNAGVLFKDGVLNVTEDEWDQTMHINLKAAFFLAQRALKDMMTRHSGYIINMVSTAAICVPPGLTAYGTSKAGLIGASQALYEEAKQYGVKVSMIYPGMTDTSMVRAAGTGTSPEQWMLPKDISSCVMFLLKSSERMIVKEIIPWATGHDQI
jgi:NAD(P)-dependent dehydrogenase (short-subunit alcohol dehydrogenase family)